MGPVWAWWWTEEAFCPDAQHQDPRVCVCVWSSVLQGVAAPGRPLAAVCGYFTAGFISFSFLVFFPSQIHKSGRYPTALLARQQNIEHFDKPVRTLICSAAENSVNFRVWKRLLRTSRAASALLQPAKG